MLSYPADLSSATLRALIDAADSDVLFLVDSHVSLAPGPRMHDRMAQVLRETGAGWVYANSAGHSHIDYQRGSIRDTFEFGAVVAVSVSAAREAAIEDRYRWGGLYDLRLRISERRPIVRIPEALYSASSAVVRTSGEEHFDYVDPRQREYQVEMEEIATEHLRRIGAYLPPRFEAAPRSAGDFPVTASVIIPVRNRERTILEALDSALGQKAAFPFNVIVVDNHSTDRTTEFLRGVRDARLVHIVPDRTDLGIGGCWGEAIASPACGRWAVQLDSDDLYSNDAVLACIVEELERGPYAMVVGSYTTVDARLAEIPPGLVDHREWSRENGRNNALRVNGFGAPRAFDTALLRGFGFPNVSYGEDYAVALRVSREHEIGRIYDSLYLCRRWEGNTDSALPLETKNRYDSYKDWIRTMEIAARQRLGGAHS